MGKMSTSPRYGSIGLETCLPGCRIGSTRGARREPVDGRRIDVAGYVRCVDEVRIRPYRPGDEGALADVFFKSVRDAGLADYTPEQVCAWAPGPPDPSRFVDGAGDGRLILVAIADGDQVIAYADLEDNGHIDHMYCLPGWVGRGVGSLLYDALENQAQVNGTRRLFVEASEAARRLFERKGFEIDHRNVLNVDGVEIHNYTMYKELQPR